MKIYFNIQELSLFLNKDLQLFFIIQIFFFSLSVFKEYFILLCYFIQNKLLQMQPQTKTGKSRFNFKNKLTIQTKNLNYKTDDQSPADSPVKKRLRKASINLKSFNNIDLRRQLSIKQGFQDCYELQEKIGQGGHSVVYKCKDLKTEKIYAVKVTRKNDPENLQGLKQQYRILASLNHESILKGHYLFLNQKKSTCHLVCQYYAYPNLRQYFVEHKNQSVDENQAGSILKSVLQAILYLHEQKVSHRDIKPQNILFDQLTGSIKIIDFEVAKMPRYTHEKLEMWTKAGTPTYRSPQLLQGCYNQSTDMWSLGIVAFQMLTKRFPFKIAFQHNLPHQILNLTPSFVGIEISDIAKNFICKLLKKDPKQRMTAKQALSHPFILSKTVSTPMSISHKKLNNSLQMDESLQQNNEDMQQYSPKSKFYDEHVKFTFLSNIDKDIGIRFCQEG